MDAQAEAEVFEHFRQLARERITILISHRFSTVRMADQIAVLNRGRIVERGSHEELMQLNGRYAQLFTLQARGYRVINMHVGDVENELATELDRLESSFPESP